MAHPLRLFRSLPRIWELRFLLPRRRVSVSLFRVAQLAATLRLKHAPFHAVSCSFMPGMSWCGLTTESSAWVACFSFLVRGRVPPSGTRQRRAVVTRLLSALASAPCRHLTYCLYTRDAGGENFYLLGTILPGLATTLRHRQPAPGYLQLQRLPAASSGLPSRELEAELRRER